MNIFERRLYQAVSISLITQIFVFSALFGNPKGEKLVAGRASVSREQKNLTIQQETEKAIINWEDFSIKDGEVTQFIQSTSKSSVLNRVISSIPSSLYGSLLANGKVYLINQNGILIGPSGKINTSSFVGSTLDILDSDFLSGNDLKFQGGSENKLINQGKIRALEGDVHLIAKEIVNEGLLTSEKGNISLSAAQEVILIEKENEIIGVKLKGEGKIENLGTIEAVQSQLKAAGGNIYSLSINQEGIIKATGAVNKEGRIILCAENAEINVSGSLKAENESLQTGGTIHVLGEKIIVKEEAKIDASAKKDGGTILIGGDYKGQNPEILNAKEVFVSNDSVIDASAKDEGNGGKIIMWSDDVTMFYGKALALGGETSGDGGFIETSSKGFLEPNGFVSTNATNGKIGIWLLDPIDVTISNGANVGIAGGTLPPPPPAVPDPYTVAFTASPANINNTALVNALGVNNVIVDATVAGAGTGDITISNQIIWGAPTTLTLIADRRIVINASVSNTHSGTGNFNAMNFTANPGAPGPPYVTGNFIGIEINNCSLSSVEGNITLWAKGGDTNGDYGLYMQTAGFIQSTGTGADAAKISVTAETADPPFGSNNIYALRMDGIGTGITSVDGTISVTATNFATGNNCYAIFMQNGAQIVAANTNTVGTPITINATNSAASGRGKTGMRMDANCKITCNTKDTTGPDGIKITATGAGNNRTSHGFWLDGGSTVDSLGTGVNAAPIEINGIGGVNGTNRCYGIFLDGAGSDITSIDGDISLTGTGNGSGTNAHGIFLRGGASVQSTGNTADAANITLDGTGANAGGGTGAGIFFNNGSVTAASTQASPNNPLIYLKGTGNGNDGISLTNASDVIGGATGGAETCDITLEANTLDFNAGDIRSTGELLMQPINPADTIGIAGGAGTFSLDATSLGILADGFSTITIGRTNGSAAVDIGAYTFLDPIIIRDATITVNGALATTGNITLNVGLWGVVGTLNLNALVTATGGTFTGNGNTNNDTFNANVVSNGILNGAAGTDTLNGPNAVSTWTISGVNSGTLASGGNTLTFNTIENLVGNANDDTFIITDTGNVDNINGAGGTNTLSYAPYTSDLNLTFPLAVAPPGITNIPLSIQSIIGGLGNDSITTNVAMTDVGETGGTNTININANASNVYGGSGTDTINISAGNITNVQTGTGNDVVNVNGGAITNVQGGTGNNSFNFNGGTVTNVQGIAGNNIYTFGGGDVTNAVIGGTGNDTFDFSLNFPITGSINGGATGVDLMIAPNATNNIWNLTANGAGTLNPLGVIFTNITDLTGGALNDDFRFSDGVSFTGIVNGGSTAPQVNTLTYSAYTTPVFVNLATNTATGTGGISNIQNMIGGITANDTIISGAGNNAWSITAADAGNINGAFTFTSVENLTGGPGDDTFDFSAGFPVSGTVNGGGVGIDLLIGPNAINTWNITANDAGNLTNPSPFNVNFVNITDFLGGTSNDTFIFADGITLTGRVDGGSVAPNANTLDYTAWTTPVVIDPVAETASNLGNGYRRIQFIIGNVIGLVEVEAEVMIEYAEINTILTEMNRSHVFLNPLYHINTSDFALDLNKIIYPRSRTLIFCEVVHQDEIKPPCEK